MIKALIASLAPNLKILALSSAIAVAVGFGSGYRLADRLWAGHVAAMELEHAQKLNEALTNAAQRGQIAAEQSAAIESENDAVEQQIGPPGGSPTVIPARVLRALEKLR